jgi:hypothetical protein
MSYKLFHVPNSTDTEYSLVFISILKGLETDDLRAKHMQQSVHARGCTMAQGQ